MLSTATLLATLLTGATLGAPHQGEPALQEAVASKPAARAEKAAPFVLCPEEGGLELRIPRDEELVFEVEVELGLIGAQLGTITFTSGVEPFRQRSVLLAGDGAPDGAEGETPLQAWVMAHCTGDHMLYTIDHTIESRFLPQDWPQTIHRSVQKGSEQRRRELKSGLVDGELILSYRDDTTDGAPKGTRVWREPRTAPLEHGYFDILTLIYAMRTLVDDNLRESSLHLADKLRIWKLDMKRGKTSVQDVPAGSFRAVEVLLASELVRRDPQDSKDEEFRGLFGLQGEVHFWADARTGVPLRISGKLPVGIFEADVDIRLAGYRGTPEDFQPLD